MTVKNALTTYLACRVGTTPIRMHAMYHDDGAREPGIALTFGESIGIGLTCEFQGTSAEVREFARQLILHCEAADYAHFEAAALAGVGGAA